MVSLTQTGEVKYRYMVATFVDLASDVWEERNKEEVVVKKWETAVRPRSVCPRGAQTFF